MDGKVRWLLDFGTRAIDDAEQSVTWTGPVLAGDRLLVVSSEGYVASVSPYTGKRLNLIKIEAGLSVPPVVAGDTVYFLTDEGDLVAFR
jgi:outer membrane protein assembly factor BamB